MISISLGATHLCIVHIGYSSEVELDLWEEATFIEEDGGLKIYEPRKRLLMIDKENRLFVYHIGKRRLPIPTYGKVILLAGETGAGEAPVFVLK